MENINTTEEVVAHIEQKKSGNGMAIAALICAILGGVLSLFLIGIPLAVIGLILGIVVLVQKKPGKGMAIASVIIGGLITLGTIIGGLFLANNIGPMMDSLESGAAEMEALMEQYPELEAQFEDPAFATEFQQAITIKTQEKMAEIQNSGEEFSMDMLSDLMKTVMDDVVTDLKIEAEALPTTE